MKQLVLGGAHVVGICNIGATYSMPHICDNLRNMWPSLVGPTHICEHPSDAISGRYLTVGLPWHPGGHIGSWPVPRIGLRSWPSHCQIISRKTACHLWCAGYPSPQQRFSRCLRFFFCAERCRTELLVRFFQWYFWDWKTMIGTWPHEKSWKACPQSCAGICSC